MSRRCVNCPLCALFHKYGNVDVGRPNTSFAPPGYPLSRKNGGHSGGATKCSPVLFHREYPRERHGPGVGRRMERGKDCVERNRSERSKVASVAEWKPPASPESEYPTVICCRIYELKH